jgi:biotin operon repressor
MAQALDIKTGSPTAKLVLLKLCDNANDNGVCWPSQDLIAEQCEITRETVNRNIKKLVAAGLIELEHQSRKGAQIVNKYKINLGVTLDHNRCDFKSQLGVTQDHTEPIIEPTNNKNTKKDLSEKLPDFIDQHLWDEFKEMRKDEKKPLNTQRKIDGVIKLLTEFETHTKGEANRSLEQSIDRCWISVFETKEKSNNQQKPKKLDSSNWDFS